MTASRCSETGVLMPGLIVIGYADQGVAEDARRSVQELEDELAIRADQVSSISRDVEGRYHAHTSHGRTPGRGAAWSALWEPLFGLLFLSVRAALGDLGETGLGDAFQERVRGLIKPGTSALFMMVERPRPDRAVAALEHYGGTVIEAPLSSEELERLKNVLARASSVQAAASLRRAP
jgi:uncharacterized membrane protein